jgi:uncharacterized protein (TIGR03437 family)
MKPLANFLKTVTRIAFVIILFICLSAGKPDGFIFRHSSAAQSATDGHGQITAAPYAEAFVISRDQGRITCRAATPEEAKSLMRREQDQRLRVISPASLDLQQPQTGLKIILRGTAQLDGFPTAKNAFIKAAQTWEALIRTPITVVIDVDYGPTFFGEPYDQNTIGSTRGQLIGSNTIYPAVRTALLARASSAQETTLYNSAPSGVIPTDIGSTAAMFAPSPLFRVLGFINATADPDAERQQLGAPPAIGFNSAMDFDFEPADGVGSDKIDFDATAVHEIGHVLGFTSNVGVKELAPDEEISASVWDLFRFRPGVTAGSFNTAQRILSSGGDHAFFDSGSELALSTGRPNGQGGDGNQASHWKDDRLIGRYIGIMDPAIPPGRREPLTEGDLRAIDVMGYQLRNAVTVATQELKLDDGTVEGGLRMDGLMIVNRLTPPAYPATLQSIRIQFRTFSGQPDPTGRSITLVYFADTTGSGMPPANAQLMRIDTTVPGTSATSFFDFPVTNGPTINSGDFYVGFAAPTPNQGVGFPLDTNSQPASRSFLSLTGGASFLPVGPPPGTTSANAMIRANVSTSGASLPTIEAPAALDFGDLAPGSSARRLLTIRNTGAAILSVTGVASDSARFAPIASSTSFVVAPGGEETIAVSFVPNAPGNFTGTLSIASNDTAKGSLNVRLSGSSGGTTLALANVSAASFSGTTLASEAIVAAFGSSLATRLETATSLPLPTSLAGTVVRVRDSAGTQRDAPLFFVSPTQVNYQIPAGTENGAATVTITSGDGSVSSGAVTIATVAPGLFAANANGQGVAAAVALRVKTDGIHSFEPVARFDSAQNRFVSTPIDLGPEGEQVFLIIFGTGLRHVSALSAVSVKLGGADCEVLFAGPQGGFAGLDQINARIPRSLIGRGEIDLAVIVDGRTANTVRANIR